MQSQHGNIESTSIRLGFFHSTTLDASQLTPGTSSSGWRCLRWSSCSSRTNRCWWRWLTWRGLGDSLLIQSTLKNKNTWSKRSIWCHIGSLVQMWSPNLKTKKLYDTRICGKNECKQQWDMPTSVPSKPRPSFQGIKKLQNGGLTDSIVPYTWKYVENKTLRGVIIISKRVNNVCYMHFPKPAHHKVFCSSYTTIICRRLHLLVSKESELLQLQWHTTLQCV